MSAYAYYGALWNFCVRLIPRGLRQGTKGNAKPLFSHPGLRLRNFFGIPQKKLLGRYGVIASAKKLAPLNAICPRDIQVVSSVRSIDRAIHLKSASQQKYDVIGRCVHSE
eukprot:CAMPEP_0173235438 /NCGR_PEP_ID=MMETSP1142-20121109/10844_1 /TAXON_ID=483371 /ORGANISM="non described non described, Strain CCMP2298" /LENGTH=109 /DNA_ID=CAMNT_0014165715 /DNA_START=274 /DNA_END=603 /DNA_ORIENTATION=-